MKDMTWKTLSSEYLIKRPWLTARRDVVQLPDGRIHNEYYVLEYPDWVNVIAMTDQGEMLLVRQYRHGLRQTNFELVAGCVEQGEDPLDAARRELLEETGYSGGRWSKLMTISANPSTNNNLTHCYLAEGVVHTSEQHLDATEDVEVHLLPLSEVKAMVSRGDFMQALMVAPLLKWLSGI
ncbi:MAG: NUDIX hydrolase [Bacteroides sp.]|nr:NUDIX hydrolase [Bacteroides sp.]